MELLCQLDLAATKAFFTTFFRLPSSYWRGFLASSLTSTQLLAFALLTFVLAPPSIQAKLVGHLLTHPAGRYLLQRYMGATGAAALTRLGKFVMIFHRECRRLPSNGCDGAAAGRAGG